MKSIQLHDQGGILVGIFGDVVQLSDSIFESLSGHLAGFFGVVQHFVVEHGEIQGQTQTDRMGNLHNFDLDFFWSISRANGLHSIG